MADENQKEERKSSGMDIKIIAAGLVIFLAAMAGSYFIARSVMSPLMPKQENEAKIKELRTTVSVGEFIVNIADIGGYRFLRTEVELELADKKSQPEIEAQMPFIRDQIITVLSSKTVADLDIHNRDALKEEIKAKLNNKLGKKVTNIYFVQFAMQ